MANLRKTSHKSSRHGPLTLLFIVDGDFEGRWTGAFMLPSQLFFLIALRIIHMCLRGVLVIQLLVRLCINIGACSSSRIRAKTQNEGGHLRCLCVPCWSCRGIRRFSYSEILTVDVSDLGNCSFLHSAQSFVKICVISLCSEWRAENIGGSTMVS